MKGNIKDWLSILICYMYDIRKFIRHSQFTNIDKNKKTSSGYILRLSHALEKGLAMPKPRLGFGITKLKNLLRQTEKYIDKWGYDRTVGISIASMQALITHHEKNNISCANYDDKINILKEFYVANHTDIPEAGNKTILKADIAKAAPSSPQDFFMTRHSIRQFEKGTDIPIEKIELIAKFAQKTPSVCNRQTCRVYFYTEPTLKEKVLCLQDGNSGFGDSAAAIAIVTSDISGFYKSGERNQGYVDGGLYAMSLVYAAHALCIGSCMLNWSQGARTDQKLRNLTDIPDSEVIITLIAFGEIPTTTQVASSPRRDLNETLSINSPLNLTSR